MHIQKVSDLFPLPPPPADSDPQSLISLNFLKMEDCIRSYPDHLYLICILNILLGETFRVLTIVSLKKKKAVR